MKRILSILSVFILLAACNSNDGDFEPRPPKEEPKDLFANHAPRFESTGINIDLSKPGMMVYKISSRNEWQIHNLNNGDEVTISELTLSINNQTNPVKSIQVYKDKADDVDFIKITLQNNKEAWLVTRKEQF